MPSSHDLWCDFVSTGSLEDIAKQILQDQDRVQNGGLPTTLALHLPIVTTQAAIEIGNCLTPGGEKLHPSIIRLLYRNIRARLLQSLEISPETGNGRSEDGYTLAAETYSHVDDQRQSTDAQLESNDLEATRRVLTHLKNLYPSSIVHIDGVIALLQPFQPESPKHFQSWSHHVKTYKQHRPSLQQRHCYVCRYTLRTPHPAYKAMCQPCGDFNMAGMRLSSPSLLKLDGRTALVTGARVNLGYHVTLRLLRCGAMVVASTRYPNDAATRYANEPDFASWKHRLRIVGADLRVARDALSLVQATRQAVVDWRATGLDILVNNAAQTLTDSVKKEERAVANERRCIPAAQATGLVLNHSELQQVYHPRVRGGVAPLALYSSADHKPDDHDLRATNKLLELPDSVKNDGRSEVEPYFKSSWVQTAAEIPFEDVVSAHAVNSFVPLLLYRELLPLMGLAVEESSTDQTNKPRGYIVNVSSREGLFEKVPAHPAKNGHHVHTNMSKAALNMITQTEAGLAWRSRRVAMNSIDPGYMSAAPEMDLLFNGERPLRWEDGAGRVLWPVAIGEVEGDAVWGRFLKQYGATPVDVLNTD